MKINRNAFSYLNLKVTNLLLNELDAAHINLFEHVGLAQTKLAAICIKNIFTDDSPKLSLLIHEALSDLFHITDIPYPYEEHKALYLKTSAIEYKDWGSGYGEITPHSDDLYEALDIDYLALTTCRDKTKTSTKCYFPKDILRDFNDEELFKLRDLQANFKSGKNVNTLIERKRNILDFSEKYLNKLIVKIGCSPFETCPFDKPKSTPQGERFKILSCTE